MEITKVWKYGRWFGILGLLLVPVVRVLVRDLIQCPCNYQEVGWIVNFFLVFYKLLVLFLSLSLLYLLVSALFKENRKKCLTSAMWVVLYFLYLAFVPAIFDYAPCACVNG